MFLILIAIVVTECSMYRGSTSVCRWIMPDQHALCHRDCFFLTTESTINISNPTAAPVITRHVNSTSTSKLFIVNITDAMPSSQQQEHLEESPVSSQNVSYLYKVQQGSSISYIWQVRLIYSHWWLSYTSKQP